MTCLPIDDLKNLRDTRQHRVLVEVTFKMTKVVRHAKTRDEGVWRRRIGAHGEALKVGRGHPRTMSSMR